MDFALYQLRTFQEVARTGSLTRAARNLGYAQSSITAHVRSLESRVGLQLLQRRPHGVALTAAGEVFQRHVSRIFHVVDEMSSDLRPEGEVTGRVAVGAAALLIEHRVSGLIQESQYRYPQVRVSPRVVATAEVEAAALAGEIHLGLTLARTAAQGPTTPGIASQLLAPVDLVVVGGPALRDPADREKQLRSTRLLVVDAECESKDALLAALKERYGLDAPVVETGSVGGARDLARQGHGIALLPEAAARQGDEDRLVVLADLPGARLPVRAVWSEQVWMSPALTAVLELARRAADREPALNS